MRAYSQSDHALDEQAKPRTAWPRSSQQGRLICVVQYSERGMTFSELVNAAACSLDLQSASQLREPDQMPWTPNDAERHTHKATTWALQELWARVANECLERTGDEGRAIREANAVVARQVEAGD